MPRAKAPAGPKPVDATRHPSGERVNDPTAELESFATNDEKQLDFFSNSTARG
jgi:hypothetical protein